MILLYLLCLVGLFLYFYSSKEGFYVGGQYDYLKPHERDVVDEKTQADFIDALNKNVVPIFPDFAKNLNTVAENYTVYATLEEIKYYIQNNQWPYNYYLMNFVASNKDTIMNDKLIQRLKITSLDNLQKVFPARLVYERFIQEIESKQSPPPLSYEIFTGKKQPTDTPTQPTPKKDGPDEPEPSLSSDNYNKLKSICSSI